jgi:hypothetical protein
MTGPEHTCALWFSRYYNIDYQLFATEEEAARFSVHMHEDAQGVTLGVQFADGRTVKVEDWAFRDEVEQRMWREGTERAARQAALPPRPFRKAHDPFAGEPIEIELSEPAWLGRQA